MSDYVKNTNYAVKDGYTMGDSRKAVKGTELDGEFNDISDAIASKADTASPTFTGTPLAPTATAGTNTTQVATTAFVTGAVSDSFSATATLTNKTISGGTITGITDLAVADGGTGASTASGARTNLGVVIGTDVLAYVAPSTSGNLLTSNGTDWTSEAPQASIGVGQTWTNVKGSRVSGTTYTNSTGKPIQVMVLTENTTNSSYNDANAAKYYIGGVVVGQTYTNNNGNTSGMFQAIIPDGVTYSVSAATIRTWYELR